VLSQQLEHRCELGILSKWQAIREEVEADASHPHDVRTS